MSNLVTRFKQLDEQLSYKLFRSVPKTKKWKSILKALEFSAHGIGWLTVTLILTYLNPEFKPYFISIWWTDFRYNLCCAN